MRVDGVNNMNSSMQTEMVQGTDATSKSISDRIVKKQQELQKASDDQDMDAKKKQEKRREITKEIASLNNQLRRHQAELREERRKKQISPVNEKPETTVKTNEDRDEKAKKLIEEQREKDEKKKEESRQTDMGAVGERAMIGADQDIRRASAQRSLAAKLEGNAAVIESEIKLDQGRGVSVEAKENALKDVRQRAQKVSSSQFEFLGNARGMKEVITKDDAAKAARKEAEIREIGRKVQNYKQKPYETVNMIF